MSISFAVVLPEPPAVASDWAEIASGELSVSIDGGAPIVIETTKGQQMTADRIVSDDRFVGAQGATVMASFLYIDDAGNRGEGTVAAITLEDTVPPVAPGQLGLVITGEQSDPPIVPDGE